MTLEEFKIEYLSDKEYVSVKTSGSTGLSKVYEISKTKFKRSALKTIAYFDLQPGSQVLLCMSLEYIAGKMMVVRALEGDLNIIEVAPQINPLKDLDRCIDFVAMLPMQFKASAVSDLAKCKLILLGGAPVCDICKAKIKELSGCTTVFESFAMTETLSHFAIKNLTKEQAYFECMEGVEVATDNRSCLAVRVDGITDGYIQTNDIVQLSDNGFEWKGRYDFLINSGGVKIIPEELELFLNSNSELLKGRNFFMTGIADSKLGQKLVFVVEGEVIDLSQDWIEIKKTFGAYKVPKAVYFLPSFVYTSNGKLDRLKTISLI